MAAFYAPSSHSFRVFDQNKENTFPTKTPGRVLGRSVGAKDAIKVAGSKTAGPKTAKGKLGHVVAGPSTVHKDVNVMATGRKPGAEVRNGKGKQLAGGSEGGERDHTSGAEIEPKRLFTQQIPPGDSVKSTKTFSSLAQPAPVTTKKAAPPTARKAPAPVRDFSTPHVNKTLPARTPAPAAVQTNHTTPLPSATRSRRRSRQSSTPNSNDGLAGSSNLLHVGHGTAQSYMTPQRGAREDDSFELGDESFGMDDDRAGDVSNGSVKVGGNLSLDDVVEEEESDGEVEYMPPKVVPLPDDPPFPMPDFKQIGRNILANPCMGMWPEEPGEVPVLHLSHTWEDVKAGGYVEDGDEDQYTIKNRTDLEDPIFVALAARKKAKAAAAKPLAIGRTNVSSSVKSTSSVTRQAAPKAILKSGAQPAGSRPPIRVARPTATTDAQSSRTISSTIRSTSGPTAATASRPAFRIPHTPVVPSKLRQAHPTISRPTTKAQPPQLDQTALATALNDRGVDLDELEKMAAGMMMDDEDFELAF